MTLKFEKYHGCGNDFIIIDNQSEQLDHSVLTVNVIKMLCDRRYGIGADGLIILESSKHVDFKMFYANADGQESTMCGNGGRCIVAFAASHGRIGSSCTFEAIDGLHKATIDTSGIVSLGMKSVKEIVELDGAYLLDTGSPHYVVLVDDVLTYPVVSEGRSIRNSESFAKEGVNVNFVEVKSDGYRIRTYERGVEDETEACGTGVTAAALVLSRIHDKGTTIDMQTNGGVLTVKIEDKPDSVDSKILLCGPATFVYRGEVEIY